MDAGEFDWRVRLTQEMKRRRVLPYGGSALLEADSHSRCQPAPARHPGVHA